MSAGELSRALSARIERLAPELLPAARRAGNLLRVGGAHGEPGQSLAIHLAGARAGQWRDFATGEHGDPLDLICAVRRCDTREAVAWARGWLGLGEPSERRPTPARPAASPAPAPAEELALRRRAALRLWLAARPTLAGTPAEFYLRQRGIDLRELGRQPRALRFHPSLICREAGTPLPALIAAVIREGEFCGAHRTYLGTNAEGVWEKARLVSPKKSLGAIAGGVIPLQRGASGRPLREAPEGETAVLGEGIETCLSIALACPELRVLCAVSLVNLSAVVLPPAIKTVIIAADNDVALGPRKLLRCAARHFVEQGRTVRVARSPSGKDFNDCIRESDKQ